MQPGEGFLGRAGTCAMRPSGRRSPTILWARLPEHRALHVVAQCAGIILVRRDADAAHSPPTPRLAAHDLASSSPLCPPAAPPSPSPDACLSLQGAPSTPLAATTSASAGSEMIILWHAICRTVASAPWAVDRGRHRPAQRCMWIAHRGRLVLSVTVRRTILGHPARPTALPGAPSLCRTLR
jgi:hypothetical protein